MINSIKKLQILLTKKERLEWMAIACLSICSAIFEVITALIIIALAQGLNDPNIIIYHIKKLGLEINIAPNKVILYLAICCGIIYLIKNIIATCEIFFQNFSIQRMNFRFKNKMLQKYANMNYSLYLTRNTSFNLNIITKDIEQMFSAGLLALSYIVSEIIIFLFLTAFIVYINPLFTAFMFTLVLIMGTILHKFIFPAFYKWGQKLQISYLRSTEKLIQFFHGFKEILIFGKKESFINAYRTHARQKAIVNALHTATNTMPRIALETVFVGLFVTAIIFLCLKHNNPIKMLGLLGGYLYLGFRVMPGLNRVISQINNFKLSIPHIEKVYTEYNTITLKDSFINQPNFAFNNNICFNNASFKYPNTNKNTLENINLTIEKGKTIGIIGETGSGKSTFIDLLLGLLKPTSGSILIDNKYPTNTKQWHKMIGYVPQSFYLMDNTIEANICFDENIKDVDSSKLKRAINLSQLDSFIKNSPKGIKTIVGDRGIRLSGGEKQRIAIARALYREPEILIFDEATSALDLETEAKIIQTIQVIAQNYTVLMIAHRISTLKNCDYILEISGEKIIKKDNLIKQSSVNA